MAPITALLPTGKNACLSRGVDGFLSQFLGSRNVPNFLVRKVTMNIRLSTIAVSFALGLSMCLSAMAQDKDKEKEEPLTETEKQIEAKACLAPNSGMSAKTDKNSHPTPEPPADKAMIYVVHPTMMGNKIQTKLAVDGSWVGVNRGDNYFYFT